MTLFSSLSVRSWLRIFVKVMMKMSFVDTLLVFWISMRVTMMRSCFRRWRVRELRSSQPLMCLNVVCSSELISQSPQLVLHKVRQHDTFRRDLDTIGQVLPSNSPATREAAVASAPLQSAATVNNGPLKVQIMSAYLLRIPDKRSVRPQCHCLPWTYINDYPRLACGSGLSFNSSKASLR